MQKLNFPKKKPLNLFSDSKKWGDERQKYGQSGQMHVFDAAERRGDHNRVGKELKFLKFIPNYSLFLYTQ